MTNAHYLYKKLRLNHNTMLLRWKGKSCNKLGSASAACEFLNDHKAAFILWEQGRRKVVYAMGDKYKYERFQVASQVNSIMSNK